jgi:hypothetical protein
MSAGYVFNGCMSRVQLRDYSWRSYAIVSIKTLVVNGVIVLVLSQQHDYITMIQSQPQ